MALKKKNKVDKKSNDKKKKFDLEEDEVNEVEEAPAEDLNPTSEFNEVISDKQILSSDPKASKVILQTYTRGKKVRVSDQTDLLVSNSIALASAGEEIVPWMDRCTGRDDFIDEAIKESSDGSEIGDLIDNSDIVDLSDSFDSYESDSDEPNSSNVEVV